MAIPPPDTRFANMYANHLPFGANAECFSTMFGASTALVVRPSPDDHIHTPWLPPRTKLNDSVFPSGLHDSGSWLTPGSGFVRRSGTPLPSAGWRKTAPSPSRSDRNVMYRPS